MVRIWGVLAVLMAIIVMVPAAAQAQQEADEPISQCLAVAQAFPHVQYASLAPVALERDEVSITFVGHATFRIETAAGVVIATDYSGNHGQGRVPDVVTMNRAHISHFTETPHPDITHVLRGWGPGGAPARHRLKVEDVYIRNVTTDIRSTFNEGGYGRMDDGNSIFIFEVAGLCIGHLGHLHHELTPSQRARIGRLDVVFVPVDGSFTMAQPAMIQVLQELRASVVIPMHAFGTYNLQRFVQGMQDDFRVEFRDTATMTISLATLPDVPSVVVLPGF